MTYVALPSYQGHHAPGTTHVQWECSHILRLNKPNKNQGTKPSADKEYDLTLPPKQSG